ncbi:MAG: hypothetical protein PVF76_05205 [Syntrophobacterales bacterium]|jgi:hypothetical protein
MSTEIEEFRAALRESLKRNREAFEGIYKKELDELLGLSREQINTITPHDLTDLEVYDKLISVVKEASRKNIRQAQLKAQIEELGNIAIEIAKRVPSLAALLV